MHVLNRIIERTDADNRRERDGGWYYPSKFFISCSCGWQEWWDNKDGAENRWIDHMDEPDKWLGE